MSEKYTGDAVLIFNFIFLQRPLYQRLGSSGRKLGYLCGGHVGGTLRGESRLPSSLLFLSLLVISHELSNFVLLQTEICANIILYAF
jgi:hypothetical protein